MITSPVAVARSGELIEKLEKGEVEAWCRLPGKILLGIDKDLTVFGTASVRCVKQRDPL